MAQRAFLVAELRADVAPFMLNICAPVAEKERRVLGECTKAALQCKIAQGWQAGNPHLGEHRWKSSRANAEKVDEFARKVMPAIQRMLGDGMNRPAIVRELNANGNADRAVALGRVPASAT
jgi:DNA invertase Pin-like site-specific DNA recombinase